MRTNQHSSPRINRNSSPAAILLISPQATLPVFQNRNPCMQLAPFAVPSSSYPTNTAARILFLPESSAIPLQIQAISHHQPSSVESPGRPLVKFILLPKVYFRDNSYFSSPLTAIPPCKECTKYFTVQVLTLAALKF